MAPRAYSFIFYRELSTRPGQPTTLDFTAAIVGIVLLLEATRRVVGPPLSIIAALMLVYAFAGPYMPTSCNKRAYRSRKPRHTTGSLPRACSAWPSACRRAAASGRDRREARSGWNVAALQPV
jgi:hypothetical protein